MAQASTAKSVRCHRCIQPVRAGSARCPNCGEKLHRGSRTLSLSVGIIGALVLLVIIGLSLVIKPIIVDPDRVVDDDQPKQEQPAAQPKPPPLSK